jgi:LPS-assembly lipoprotein
MNFARQINGSMGARRGGPGWALRVASLALLALLSACGFQMRGTTPLPFDSLYIGIAPNSRFGAEVRRAIAAASPDTKLVDTPKEAEAILQQVRNSRSMREVSLNAQGRVEEYELGLVFTFRVIDAKGRALLPDTTLEAYREMQYNDQVVQAKEGQAESLYRNMEQSLVSRIVRRLTAPDVRLAAQKLETTKPGDEQGPVYSITQPTPQQNDRLPWNRPSITNGPASPDDDGSF